MRSSRSIPMIFRSLRFACHGHSWLAMPLVAIGIGSVMQELQSSALAEVSKKLKEGRENR